MKTKLLTTLLLSAAVAMSLAFSSGCSREIAHSESDKPGWFGGTVHKESTTYQNPDGTISSEHSSQTIR